MSQKACCCNYSTKKGNEKDTIVITIETCDKRNAQETSDATTTSRCPSTVTCKPSCPALITLKNKPSTRSCCVATRPSAGNNEASARRLFTLPIIPPRHHGPGCAMEISIIEKHDHTCQFKKEENPNRNDLDDKVGSYECIGRMVFRTCNGGADGAGSSSFPPCAQPPCGNRPPCGPNPPCAPVQPCATVGCQAKCAQMAPGGSNAKRKCVPGCPARCSQGTQGSQAVFRLLAQSILDPSFKWNQDLSKYSFLTQPQPLDSINFQKDHCESFDHTSFLDADREKLSHIENAIKLRQEIEMLVTSLRTFATRRVDVGNQVPSHITTSAGVSYPTLTSCKSFDNFKCKGSIQTSQETIISLGTSHDIKLSKTESISSISRLKAFFKCSKHKDKNETKKTTRKEKNKGSENQIMDKTENAGDEHDDDKSENENKSDTKQAGKAPVDKKKNKNSKKCKEEKIKR